MTQLRMDLATTSAKSNISAAINAAHQAVKDAERSAVRHAADCGRLLNEAKATVPHGGWGSWVNDHCRFSMRTAQLYMKLADYLADGDPAKAQRVADLSLREIQALLAEIARPSMEEREKAADRQRFVEDVAGHFLCAGPLERRGLLLGLTISGIGGGSMTPKACAKELAKMNKHDLPRDEAADSRFNSEGLSPAGGIMSIRRRNVATPLTDRDLETLFDLAGPQATVLGCVIADHFLSCIASRRAI